MFGEKKKCALKKRAAIELTPIKSVSNQGFIQTYLFAQTEHFKHVSSQAAQLSIFYIGKSVVLHLHEVPD